MSGQKGDVNQLALSIDQMLQNLSPRSENPSIHRVEDLLRSTNEFAYDPRIVSIGPFHRGKKHLENMEQEKKCCLKLLLRSRSEPSVDRYVQKIKEGKARKCYDEPITLESGEFVEMLLLDSIFIIEFLRKYDNVNDDAIFKFRHVIAHVLHDLVLLENQIPFFIFEEIFGLTKAYDQENISELIKHLVSPREMPESCASMQNVSADHLLDLVHQFECHSFHEMQSSRKHCETENINSAEELKEAGIQFKQCNKKENSWLDIRFKKKRIYMPVLQVSDVTESWFRNMIAYEYYLPRDNPKYITDYMFFLHCLIHASRDAQLLRQRGIISNWIGGDEIVYRLINQMGSNVLPSESFSYSDVFQDVNRHCQRRRNRWIAILRRDYFDSPWKLISLVAGVVLLGATIAQLVFAILSYRNDRKKGS